MANRKVGKMTRNRKAIIGFFLVMMLLVMPLQSILAAAEPTCTVSKCTVYVGGSNYQIAFKNLAAKATVTYKSSNAKIASVTAKGVIKPVAKGSATVTITIKQNKKTYTRKITVTVAEPALKETKKTLYVGGDNYKIAFKNNAAKPTISYKSSNTKIARVTTAGVIKPVAAGSAKITVTIKQGGKTFTRTIAITVAKPSVKITTNIPEMEVGDSIKLDAVTYGLKNTKAVWSVSDKTVLSFTTKTRELKALKAGTAKVTFKDKTSGLFHTVTVTVKEPVEELPEDEMFTYELYGAGVMITGVNDSSVTSLTVPSTLGGKKVVRIDDGGLEYLQDATSIVLPSTLIELGDGALEGCSSLKTLTLPAKLTKIGENAFEGCTALTSIKIPDTVTELGAEAFLGCENLKSVTLSKGLKSIENNTFEECVALASIDIPAGVERIGEEAFVDCTALATVTIAKTVKEINANAFSGCETLNKLTLNSGLEYIGDNAFSDCVKLTTVSIPGTVKEIGSDAFSGCEKLSKVTLNTGLETIGRGAFDGCEALKSVKIPASTEDIGSGAFDNCSESFKLSVKKNSAGQDFAESEDIPFSTY